MNECMSEDVWICLTDSRFSVTEFSRDVISSRIISKHSVLSYVSSPSHWDIEFLTLNLVREETSITRNNNGLKHSTVSLSIFFFFNKMKCRWQHLAHLCYNSVTCKPKWAYTLSEGNATLCSHT